MIICFSFIYSTKPQLRMVCQQGFTFASSSILVARAIQTSREHHLNPLSTEARFDTSGQLKFKNARDGAKSRQ